MPGFDNNETPDFYSNGTWYTTVSGGGSTHISLASWEDDYTRTRTGGLNTTYNSTDDIIGKVKTGRELDKDKI